MEKNQAKVGQSGVWGAIFLMATSAIGPGFLTQTAVFTEQLKANFGFIILISTLLDILIQGIIWRVITFSGLPASKLLDRWFTHAGKFLSFAVVFGGLIFNIGNLGGSGLGLQAMFPSLSVLWGSGLSALMVFVLLYRPQWRPVLDLWTVALGVLFLALLGWGLWQVKIPWQAMGQHTFLPTEFNAFSTLTLVGGTVGGYISFVGAHRLVEAGMTGSEVQPQVWRSAISGILLTSLVRFALFALFLGLLESDPARTWQSAANPAGQAFAYLTSYSAFFGLILWSAAITSTLGATYTSFTFLRSYWPAIENPQAIGAFLLISWGILAWWGRPATLLVFAGTVNSLVLPFGLAGLLWVGHRSDIPLPKLVKWLGWLVVGAFFYLFLASYLN